MNDNIKARFFGAHIGCGCECEWVPNKIREMPLLGVVGEIATVMATTMPVEINISKCKLVLRPL